MILFSYCTDTGTVPANIVSSPELMHLGFSILMSCESEGTYQSLLSLMKSGDLRHQLTDDDMQTVTPEAKAINAIRFSEGSIISICIINK